MPLFEYQCLKCGRISEHLVLNEKNFSPYCRYCGGTRVKKIISRVRVRLSMESRLEKLADPLKFGDLDENDPKSMMKLMDRMGAEFGDQLGDEFEEVMEEAKNEIEAEASDGKKDEGKESNVEED